MAEVVGVHYDVNSLVVEVRDLESDVHWQIAFLVSKVSVFLMKGTWENSGGTFPAWSLK